MNAIPILLALVIAISPCIALGQGTTQITLLTDKQSYTTGDTISISGTISSLGASNSAVLQVFNRFNVLVQIGTINVAPDGTFHDTIKAEGQSWENDGSYQIKVIYVSTPILATASTNVNFKTTQSTPSQTVTQPIPPVQSDVPSDTQNITQTSIEEQIKKRITLANNLKQQQQSTTIQIPSWVKYIASKWHDGTINNAAFGKDIQYLISSGLVRVSGQITPTNSFEHIPSWQKDVAQWWSQGLVSDYDYVNSIQYLIDKKIIK